MHLISVCSSQDGIEDGLVKARSSAPRPGAHGGTARVRGDMEEAMGISWSNAMDVRGQSMVVAGVRTRPGRRYGRERQEHTCIHTLYIHVHVNVCAYCVQWKGNTLAYVVRNIYMYI